MSRIKVITFIHSTPWGPRYILGLGLDAKTKLYPGGLLGLMQESFPGLRRSMRTPGFMLALEDPSAGSIRLLDGEMKESEPPGKMLGCSSNHLDHVLSGFLS